MSEFLRKRAVATDLDFPLVDFGATDFEDTPVTFAAGDVKISKDGGALANTPNLPTHIGGGLYTIALTAAEMTADRISIILVDQTATKEWEDQGLLTNTEHLPDINAEMVDVLTVDTLAELAQATPPATPTIAQALTLLYMMARNKRTSTATFASYHNDAGVITFKGALSDNGVTFTHDELQSGP